MLANRQTTICLRKYNERLATVGHRNVIRALARVEASLRVEALLRVGALLRGVIAGRYCESTGTTEVTR